MSGFNRPLVFASISFIVVICSLYVAAESYSEVNNVVGGVGTMNIMYCYSCGYRKVFDDYAGIIQQKYPEIAVYGSNYDPPGLNMYLSRFIGIAKMLLIACVLGGLNIFAMINRPQPSWWSWCIENKLYACTMLFFLCNTIEGQLVSSGAFEISLNDMPVWSKLETGRIPQPAELFQIIDSTIQFSSDAAIQSGFVK